MEKTNNKKIIAKFTSPIRKVGTSAMASIPKKYLDDSRDLEAEITIVEKESEVSPIIIDKDMKQFIKEYQNKHKIETFKEAVSALFRGNLDRNVKYKLEEES